MGLKRRLSAGRYRRDLPAIGVSMAFHVTILAILGVVGIAAQSETQREITTKVVEDTTVPPFDQTEVQDIDQAEAKAVLNTIGSTATTAGPLALAGSTPVMMPTKSEGTEGSMKLTSVNVTRPGDLVMPTAETISKTVAIRSTGAEHVDGVEGAVDRVAMELLNRLGQGKVLVVWAFDASGSLVAEREKLSKHIDEIYTHITQLDKDQIAGGDALMTMVVAFGQDRKAMLPEPTSDQGAIIEAIHQVPLDTTGIESTFTTVSGIVSKWGKYKDGKGQKYQTVIIVVTDEVGDDESQLESAISSVTAAKVPVYVLGSSSPFGKVEGRMNYTDPKTKKTYYNLAVRQGPESVAVESIHLPFWYGGDQYENLDAGFGPYALSRLANASGGIYFLTRIGGGRVSFLPSVMREYKPDQVSPLDYERSLAKHPLRRAVIEAAILSQQKVPGQPGLNFSSADSPEFKEQMSRNQETIALIEYVVGEALPPITAVSKLRDRETSRRWQAHYDLIRGRLLAMKIRCAEYQTACAKMKKDAPKFKDSKSNAWRLVPTEQILSGDRVASVAKETRALLQRVVDDHPGTPWALLAQRELKDPFGFKWVEVYVPPPPKRNEAEAAAAKKKKAEPKKEMPKPIEIKL